MTATAINLIASSNADLLDKLHTFLTSNADLVAANEEWVSMEYTAGDNFILKGRGLGATEEIYVGWRIINNVGTGVYNIEMRGFGGYINGNTWDMQPFTMPDSVYLCADNANFNYWFVANGRRFIVIAKVQTVYLSCYCGLILPYATPTQYPYPLLISASTQDANVSFSSVSDITHAGHPTGSSNTAVSAHINYNSGWGQCKNRGGTGSVSVGDTAFKPFNDTTFRQRIRDNIDGSYTVFKCIPENRLDSALVGELEGYGWVSGFDQSSESTITFGGDTWLVIQDVYRLAAEDFYAVRLL